MIMQLTSENMNTKKKKKDFKMGSISNAWFIREYEISIILNSKLVLFIKRMHIFHTLRVCNTYVHSDLIMFGIRNKFTVKYAF